MASHAARIQCLAARLLAATGGDEITHITLPGGAVRLAVDVPRGISAAARHALLLALADADSYGHGRDADAEHVWATVDPGGQP